jgi:hypothetical protein
MVKRTNAFGIRSVNVVVVFLLAVLLAPEHGKAVRK